jgi:hypothetical protein
MSKVNCSQHGLAGNCVHAAVAIDTGEAVGFYFDESEAPPLAWCGACEQVRLQATERDPSVNWSADVEFKCVCEHCYQLAKARLFRYSSYGG